MNVWARFRDFARSARLVAAEHARTVERDRLATVEMEVEARRPSVTRTVAGGLVGGPVGALVGFAWWKRTRRSVRVSR